MKDQYLILLFAFGFMAAYRFTVSLDLRGILQMTLFALPWATWFPKAKQR